MKYMKEMYNIHMRILAPQSYSTSQLSPKRTVSNLNISAPGVVLSFALDLAGLPIALLIDLDIAVILTAISMRQPKL